jgi:hypothetical protein
MERSLLRIAASQTEANDYAAMAQALDRLRHAALTTVSDVVASLSASERAKLAVHCYGRAHLNTIGLAIAAECDLDHLIAASNSTTAGQTLYAQSRGAGPLEKPLYGKRKITLARSVETPSTSMPELLTA